LPIDFLKLIDKFIVSDVFVDFPDQLGFTVEAYTCGKPFAQFR
jgi:hypothetical protein